MKQSLFLLLVLLFSSTTFAEDGVAPSGEKAASPDATRSTSSDEPVDTAYGKKGETLIRDLAIVPRLTIIDIPRPLRLGGEVLWKNFLGGGVDVGYLPMIKVTSDHNIKAGYDSWSLVGRVFPWKRRFFVGTYFGKTNLTAQSEDTYGGVPARVTIEANATFFTPHIGWRFVFDSGFFFQLEVGAHLPISSSSALTVIPNIAAVNADAEFQKAKKDVEDLAKNVVKQAIPAVSLLTIGFMF